MIDAILRAARQTLSAPFRSVLWKSLGITAPLLVAGWFGIKGLADRFVTLPNETASFVARIVAEFGAAVGLLFLVAPVTALVASFFLDDIAEIVEKTDYPNDPPGTPVPLLRGLFLSARFALLVLALNILLLVLIFIPGVNLVAWLVVNGYLLSREYFSLAALRFRTEQDATALRRRHRLKVFMSGVVVAGLAVVPFANLLTPLFATALFVHLHKRVSADEVKRLGNEGRSHRLGA